MTSPSREETELRGDNATTCLHHTNVPDFNRYESKESIDNHPQPKSADRPDIKSTGQQTTRIVIKQYRDDSQRTR